MSCRPRDLASPPSTCATIVPAAVDDVGDRRGDLGRFCGDSEVARFPHSSSSPPPKRTSGLPDSEVQGSPPLSFAFSTSFRFLRAAPQTCWGGVRIFAAACGLARYGCSGDCLAALGRRPRIRISGTAGGSTRAAPRGRLHADGSLRSAGALEFVSRGRRAAPRGRLAAPSRRVASAIARWVRTATRWDERRDCASVRWGARDPSEKSLRNVARDAPRHLIGGAVPVR